MSRPSRRAVLAAGGALTIAAAARAKAAGIETLTLFDPAEPAARAFAAKAGRRIAIVGDRIRLARRVFAESAPQRLTVIGRHADVVLLSEAAREAGYRPLAHEPFPAADGRDGLFLWTANLRA